MKDRERILETNWFVFYEENIRVLVSKTLIFFGIRNLIFFSSYKTYIFYQVSFLKTRRDGTLLNSCPISKQEFKSIFQTASRATEVKFVRGMISVFIRLMGESCPNRKKVAMRLGGGQSYNSTLGDIPWDQEVGSIT